MRPSIILPNCGWRSSIVCVICSARADEDQSSSPSSSPSRSPLQRCSPTGPDRACRSCPVALEKYCVPHRPPPVEHLGKRRGREVPLEAEVGPDDLVGGGLGIKPVVTVAAFTTHGDFVQVVSCSLLRTFHLEGGEPQVGPVLDGDVLDIHNLRLIGEGDVTPPSIPRGAGMDRIVMSKLREATVFWGEVHDEIHYSEGRWGPGLCVQWSLLLWNEDIRRCEMT